MKTISVYLKTEAADRCGGIIETIPCGGYVDFEKLLYKYKGQSFIAKYGEKTVAEGHKYGSASKIESSVKLVREDGSSYTIWEQWRKISASNHWFTL